MIDISFFELVNHRLDEIKYFNSSKYYRENTYCARVWVKHWGSLRCSQISRFMIKRYLMELKKKSIHAANRDLRLLRACFNLGFREGFLLQNPTFGIKFFPIEKKERYVPPIEDIQKVIETADEDTQDYLCFILETMCRASEVNNCTWQDVNFDDRCVTLYTQKKKGGHLTPRRVAMSNALYEILDRRRLKRHGELPLVFWHEYVSSKTGERCIGPYQDRKRIMRRQCKEADVMYFRFHALRHAGVSMMDNAGISIGTIQKILGHENRKTTEIYLHSVGDAERQAISVYEGVWKKLHINLHTFDSEVSSGASQVIEMTGAGDRI